MYFGQQFQGHFIRGQKVLAPEGEVCLSQEAQQGVQLLFSLFSFSWRYICVCEYVHACTHKHTGVCGLCLYRLCARVGMCLCIEAEEAVRSSLSLSPYSLETEVFICQFRPRKSQQPSSPCLPSALPTSSSRTIDVCGHD